MTKILSFAQMVGGLALLLLSNAECHAEVRVYPIFSDNMVLQRDKPIRVWGTAGAGEKVSVSIGKQSRDTVADGAGNWRVSLKKMRVARNQTLTVKGGNEVVFENIAVGDVYVCSGQSNMEWPLRLANKAAEEVAAANYADIRLFSVPNRISATPQSGFSSPVNWQLCTPQSTANFSAVGYFFGRELNRQLGIPIGLISASWGGTYAQAWTSPETLNKRDDLRGQARQTTALLQATTAASAAASGLDPRTNPNQPGVLYNGMIAPLVDFPIRGVIWYQGESNDGAPVQYRTLFPDMIRGWRDSWHAKQNGSELGFYFVQLANYSLRVPEPVQTGWAELREAQTMALKLPRTGMATTLDIGDAVEIHPRNKQDVGKRLALVALAKEYGKNVEFTGPIVDSVEITPDTREVKILWKHAQGLRTTDGRAPQAFAIQGDDGKWYTAQAKIEGENIVLWCEARPIAVRYAWANNPIVNLVNDAGLPAVSFRTDTPK